MTLREFIEQERRDCHVFDIEEFFDRLQFLEREDGEEIEPEEFEDYLDYNLESAAMVHSFGKYAYSMHYEITLADEE